MIQQLNSTQRDSTSGNSLRFSFAKSKQVLRFWEANSIIVHHYIWNFFSGTPDLV